MISHKYECILRDTEGYKWSMMFDAESFAHAEEQCLDATTDELIQIVKVY